MKVRITVDKRHVAPLKAIIELSNVLRRTYEFRTLKDWEKARDEVN